MESYPVLMPSQQMPVQVSSPGNLSFPQDIQFLEMKILSILPVFGQIDLNAAGQVVS
jgi:hypothetical protein